MYTDVWDVTAPLDTQAANQGAADFRATKLDVMQRIASFGAGLLASRPTPETTSGTADWTGVMYWATDTHQVFRWNGTAWIDISSSIPGGTSGAKIICDGVPHTMAIDTTVQTIYTAVVAANSLGTTGGLRGSLLYSLGASTGKSIAVNITFGGTSVQMLFANSAGRTGRVDYSIINQGVANGQSLVFTVYDNANTVLTGYNIGLTIDTTANQTLSITAQKTQSTDSGLFVNGYAEFI